MLQRIGVIQREPQKGTYGAANQARAQSPGGKDIAQAAQGVNHRRDPGQPGRDATVNDRLDRDMMDEVGLKLAVKLGGWR